MVVFPRPVSNFAEHETHFLNGLLFLFPLPVPFSSSWQTKFVRPLAPLVRTITQRNIQGHNLVSGSATNLPKKKIYIITLERKKIFQTEPNLRHFSLEQDRKDPRFWIQTFYNIKIQNFYFYPKKKKLRVFI